MKILIKHLLFILIIFIIGCSSDKNIKVSSVKGDQMEIQMKNAYKEALDAPIKSISDLPYNSDTINVFANYILRDCILVAYIEGGYSDDEKSHISEIAAELGVSQQTLNSIEQAVEHHVKSIELWSPLI